MEVCFRQGRRTVRGTQGRNRHADRAAANRPRRVRPSHSRDAQRLADIETEAQAKIQTAIDQGNAERQQILTQARQEAEAEVARARAEIQQRKDDAILELRGVVAELAIDAAGKIISEELNADRHQHIIDVSIRRLPTDAR